MFIKRYLIVLFVLLTIQATTEVIAQQSKLDTLSLDEISRKLENPLSSLWSLTFQENYIISTGTFVDGSATSNNFFFQPFLPFPVGNMKMLVIIVVQVVDLEIFRWFHSILAGSADQFL